MRIFAAFIVLCVLCAEVSAQPNVEFSTYLGGIDGDTLRDVDIAADGSFVVTGGTKSPDYPTKNAHDSSYGGIHDVALAKFDKNHNLLWSTFLGGTGYERAYAVELGPNDSVYICGRAGPSFPTTPGVVQPTFAGDNRPNGPYGQQDGLVAKFTSSGQLLWATYLGGDSREFIRDCDVDASGNVYVALTEIEGTPGSMSHLITPNTYGTTRPPKSNGLILKLSADGKTVIWGTYFGGSNTDMKRPSIRVDAQGYVIVSSSTDSSDLPRKGPYSASYAGNDDFHVVKFLPDGSDIVYSTYLGGSELEEAETHTLALDSAGNAYIASYTRSSNFPTTPGAAQTSIASPGVIDGFVSKISPNGALIASTYIGGNAADGIEGIAIGDNGDVFVSGWTASTNLPVTSNATQASLAGAQDMWMARLSSDLKNIVFATYHGGGTYEQARSSWTSGSKTYLVGHTNSIDFPLMDPYDSTRNGSPNVNSKFSGDQAIVIIDSGSQTRPKAPTNLRER